MQNAASQRANSLLEKFDFGQIAHGYIDPLLIRLLDVTAGALGLLLLAPLFLLIAVLIKRDSPGPVFYRGPRTGRNGKHFRILKFRTMFERPESYSGPKITGQGDVRITQIGQWLRDTKLNELPQLWNVLVGEMSLVGPRPEDPDYVERWPNEMRHLLLSVRPGITSPASIVYRDEERMLQTTNVDDVYLNAILPSKLRLDSRYVKQRSILSNLDVIFWTLIMLMPLLKKKQIPDHLLFWGPLARLVSRYFSWFFIDALVAFSAVVLSELLWRTVAPLDVGMAASVPLAILVTFVFSLANTALGLDRIAWSRASSGYILALFGSTLLATIALLLVSRNLPVFLPHGLLLLTGVLAWLGFVTVRYRSRLIVGGARHWLKLRPNTSALQERALIIGAGGVGCFAASMLRKGILSPAYSIIGLVDDDPRMVGIQINEYRVLGTTIDITKLVTQFEIDVLVFTIEQLSREDRERILGLCQKTTARVIFLPDIISSTRAKFINGPSNMEKTFPKDQLHGLLDEVERLLKEKRVNEALSVIRTFQTELSEDLPNENVLPIY
ncbi:MAG: sugar transferase [Candidatus Promineifilaceae bacterium]|nr:sugar transferase [Candidatus Promineifilaceae bacterium]